MTLLTLKPKSHNRVRNGHLWIFRDELAPHEPLQAGTLIRLHTDYGYDLGVGVYHPTSQIAVRLLRWQNESLDGFFEQRITEALQLRARLFPAEPTYRLVFGESDFLPGLIIDRYGDYFAMQLLSAGMDVRKNEIINAIRTVFPNTKGIIAKNDSQLRVKEGLRTEEEVVYGEIPDEITVTENGITLSISLTHGQKTGYFLDQRRNRAMVAELSNGLSVLDCFTNQGGFALNAAKGGASRAVGVDISASAIERCKRNAELNGFENCEWLKDDVFDYLKQQAQQEAKWDMVILDPPAFTKSKANIPQAKRGYAEINRQALKLITNGGFLVSSSCSHHIAEPMFLEIIEAEAKRINRKLKLIQRGMQSPCHPIYVPMPETQYLKFFVFEVR
ncbi:MAG: class I SAM-dependent rRNA methyltransferase [Candidatus Kapaibacterium sp.]